MQQEYIKRFTVFCLARQRLYLQKTTGAPPPWTTDPILAQYRFCNIYREQDKVTRWIRNVWAPAHADRGDMWFAMTVARLINWPGSLAFVPAVVPWRPKVFRERLEGLQREDVQVFGPAYIVSTNGRAMPKLQYLDEQVLTPMWELRDHLRPRKGDTLARFHERLMECQGMGSFMAAQVVADVKNTKGAGLDPKQATDWMTWCAPGPGSLRGLNRICGNGAVRTGLNQTAFLQYVDTLRRQLNEAVVDMGWKPLCAQDVQNCLCEFDKYERVRLGEGTPKQRYEP